MKTMHSELMKQWATKQAKSILDSMEKHRVKETLTLQWPQMKQGFLLGFLAASELSFKMGFETALKVIGKTDQKQDPQQLELPLDTPRNSTQTNQPT